MQIRVEIDVKPDELRRFLGLPDVSGLQDDIVAFLRDKVGAATEFDATGFVKQNLDTLKKIPAWQKIVARIRVAEDDSDGSHAADDADLQTAAKPKPRKRTAAAKAGKSTGGRRRKSSI